MDTITTDTTTPDKAITVDVPADRVPEFYAWYARFLAGDAFRGRGGRRGGPGRHRHHGGPCHHEGHGHHGHDREEHPAEQSPAAPAPADG